ncbi:MAG: hypothetical protein M5U10_04920 [Candidatus Methanoperedens sp.]|uniref:hypothetical protein n=1 Tax=Candidatus Methanoperedens nitratireducens TaxID=1392998 RepID=UPI00064EEE7C|nr:hypothetical protein [Candidatus Methanoperedens nitroreducens]MDJ1421242.1 hypothetical protein [Candidatus Methanoperedens sp.]
MSTPWISLTVRLRPDQITKFQELYPEKQLTPVIRMLLDTFLDGKKATHKRIDEVRRLREKTAKHLEMLEAEEAQLLKEEHHAIMDDALQELRLNKLSERPEILSQHRNKSISSAGYAKLQQELKFSSRQQLIKFLDSHANEARAKAEGLE